MDPKDTKPKKSDREELQEKNKTLNESARQEADEDISEDPDFEEAGPEEDLDEGELARFEDGDEV